VPNQDTLTGADRTADQDYLSGGSTTLKRPAGGAELNLAIDELVWFGKPVRTSEYWPWRS
jgi:hypothetical protein